MPRKAASLPSTNAVATALQQLLSEDPNGFAPAAIYEKLAERMEVKKPGLALTVADGKRSRWSIRVQAARQRLVERGVVSKAQRGWWRLKTGSDAASVHALLRPSEASTTEREQVILARLGQGCFRDALIARDKGCALCQLGDLELLVASHIKPWRDATDAERLNPANGLLLCPGSDRLFDHGLMTFDGDGEARFSPHLSTRGRGLACFPKRAVLAKEALARSSVFLDHHRQHVYRS